MKEKTLMKKKLFTRPVSVVLSEEMFDQIKTITDHGEISISDYIRFAIMEKLAKETTTIKEEG
jgi:Arc/MetJ-type ribon-helix-helix transcriptional regulator